MFAAFTFNLYVRHGYFGSTGKKRKDCLKCFFYFCYTMQFFIGHSDQYFAFSGYVRAFILMRLFELVGFVHVVVSGFTYTTICFCKRLFILFHQNFYNYVFIEPTFTLCFIPTSIPSKTAF